MIAMDWGVVINRLCDAVVSLGSMEWWRWILIALCFVVMIPVYRGFIEAFKDIEGAFDLTHPGWWNEEKKSIRQIENEYKQRND